MSVCSDTLKTWVCFKRQWTTLKETGNQYSCLSMLLPHTCSMLLITIQANPLFSWLFLPFACGKGWISHRYNTIEICCYRSLTLKPEKEKVATEDQISSPVFLFFLLLATLLKTFINRWPFHKEIKSKVQVFNGFFLPRLWFFFDNTKCCWQFFLFLF